MKISPCFTHPQGILGVYDFFLSGESNQSNIKNRPGSFKLYNGMGRFFLLYMLLTLFILLHLPECSVTLYTEVFR